MWICSQSRPMNIKKGSMSNRRNHCRKTVFLWAPDVKNCDCETGAGETTMNPTPEWFELLFHSVTVVLVPGELCLLFICKQCWSHISSLTTILFFGTLAFKSLPYKYSLRFPCRLHVGQTVASECLTLCN